MPIDKKEFETSPYNLEEEILSFLDARRGKAFTSDEIMGATSLRADFDLHTTMKIATFVVANFVAVLNNLVAQGKIKGKVVNNRMYFMAL